MIFGGMTCTKVPGSMQLTFYSQRKSSKKLNIVVSVHNPIDFGLDSGSWDQEVNSVWSRDIVVSKPEDLKGLLYRMDYV